MPSKGDTQRRHTRIAVLVALNLALVVGTPSAVRLLSDPKYIDLNFSEILFSLFSILLAPVPIVTGTDFSRLIKGSIFYKHLIRNIVIYSLYAVVLTVALHQIQPATYTSYLALINGGGLILVVLSTLMGWSRTRKIEAASRQNIEALARIYVERIFSVSVKFGLLENSKWTTDYAIGFIEGHIFQAQLRGREDPTLRWSYGSYDWKVEFGAIYIKLMSEIFGLDSTAAATALSRTAGEELAIPGSEHESGLLAANRILLLIEESGPKGTDRHTLRIRHLAKRFQRLPGQPWYGALLWVGRMPGVYEYMVVRTLGEDIFGFHASDVELAGMLGIGRRAGA